MQKFAIIVAGGSGSRMKSDIPKQYLPIANRPILIHTVEKFLQIEHIQVILAIPAHDFEVWENLVAQESSDSLVVKKKEAIKLVAGGATRFQSVRNGLLSIEATEGLVAVHDGVRPLITTEIIENSYQIAAEKITAVTSVPLKDSARIINKDGSNKSIDRTQLRLMQTPQTFQLNEMRKAFQSPEQPFFTDCASVFEFAGYTITLIDGIYENIKVTTPEDLILAEAFLRK